MGRLNVKVVPGSSRNQIVGWLGDALKIKVSAPPEKGRANEAVMELLATKLGISTDDIEVESGHSSPSKVVAILRRPMSGRFLFLVRLNRSTEMLIGHLVVVTDCDLHRMAKPRCHDMGWKPLVDQLRRAC